MNTRELYQSPNDPVLSGHSGHSFHMKHHPALGFLQIHLIASGKYAY